MSERVPTDAEMWAQFPTEADRHWFKRWLAAHDRRVQAVAWWNGVYDQWLHAAGNRIGEWNCPYTAPGDPRPSVLWAERLRPSEEGADE